MIPLSLSSLIAIPAFLAVSIISSLAGEAVLHPAIPETPASKDYSVKINGKELAVNDESYFDFHTAFFSMDEPAEITVTLREGLEFKSIHPLRHAITPEEKGRAISFTVEEPLKLVFKAKGAKPLALCITPKEISPPMEGDPNVIYFGPGVHEAGIILPKAGQTVYLAPGALVKGRIEVIDADNVKILGRGTINGKDWSVRKDKTHVILYERSNNALVQGIGIRGGTWWQTNFLVCEDVLVEHLSLFGKTVNTDGIDLDGTKRLTARHCFIRCEDDGFGWHAVDAKRNGEPSTEDCLAEDCVIWNTKAGNGLRVGASMETGLFKNITFRRIDVLAQNKAAIYADHSDWAKVENLRFEDFIDETKGTTVQMYVAKTRYSNKERDERGSFDGLTFTRLQSPGGKIILKGHGKDNLIENVRFEDCQIGGKTIKSLDQIEVNEFVKDVEFSGK